MDGANKEKLLVYCLDLKTGRQLWLKEFANTVLPVKVNLTVSKAAPTPVVDDKGLYVFFETGDLYGFDHDGKLRWQRQLMTDYGAFKGPHGLGGSLVMNKDSLFVHVAHQGAAFLLAVNKRDGKTLWKTDRAAGKCCWTTPLVVTHQGKQQIIIQDNDAAAFDTATGKALWTFTGGFTGNAMAAPTVSDGLVLLGYDVKGKNLALKLGGTGDVTQSHVAWRAEEASLNYNSPLIHQGLVYYVNKVGVAFCLELATGKELWRQRLNAGPCWASPLAVGDRIYIFSNDGKTTVLRAGTKYEELAVNTLKDMQHVYGVAAVDGALLLRFEKRLIRLSESM
jgi:outer membrane protein assembly factor BamB